jgi:hypothetical protein
MIRSATLAALAALVAGPVLAQDRADLDATRIVGNRELPQALYIVPWKRPLPGDLVGRPPASVVDEALAPIDRDVFRREVRYDAIERARMAAAAPPRPPAAPPAAAPASSAR